MAASQVIKVVFEGIDKTSKAAKSVQKGLGDTEKAIGNLKRSLGGMTTALAGAAGAAGFGLMARNALQTADALGKTSQKLGVTANELFKFQTQAELAGISTDTANMALQRFVRRTAEAAQGTGEAKNALIELGVNAAEIQKLPLPERMKVLADAFAGVQNPADRLRLAFKLFDSEGASMVNMLEGGREPLEETERRMRELGIEIDDTAIPAMEEFNDSMELMKRQVQVAMIEGLGEATPVLQDLSNKLAPVIVQITQGLLEGLQWLLNNIETVTTYVKNFAMAWAGFKALQVAVALAGLAKAMGVVRLAALALTTAMGPIAIAITAISGAAVYFADDLKALGKRLGILEDDTDDAAKETDNFTGSIEDLQEIVVDVERKAIPDFAKEVDNLADEEIAATRRTNEFRVALEKLREKAIKPQKDLEDYAAKVAILNEQFKDKTSEEYQRQMAELAKEYTGVKDKVQDLIDEKEMLEKVIKSMTGTTLEGTSVFEAHREELRDVEEQLEELTGATAGMTAEQKKLYEETTRVETSIEETEQALSDLKDMYDAGIISVDQYRRQSVELKGELKSLREDQLSPLGRAISNAFDDTAIGEFLSTMEGLNSDPIFGELLGSFGSTKTAIDGCFSTTPVTDFGQAIKDLFTGGGSALGGFGDALANLTGALGSFFSGALGKFGSFKTAVIQILNEIAASAIASVGINFLKNLIPGINTGGLVGEFAEGGRVFGSGGPKEDKVLARLSAGEYVINAASVSKFGTGFFDMLNDGKMAMPGFQGGGFVGFDPYSIAITSILNKIFGGIFDALFGGESESRKKFKIRSGTLNYMQESFLEVLQQIGDNYGFGRRLYRRTKPKRQGGIDLMEDRIIPEIMNAILPPGADLGHHEKVAEGINAIGPGFAEMLYNFLVPRLLDIRFRTVDFNMDDLVKKLFDDANAVAGGSLFLQGRQFGGPLERGQASVVGEDGPELFVPSRRGQVSPISRDGGRELVTAVREVKAEVAALRRQMDRQNPVQLAGGRI